MTWRDTAFTRRLGIGLPIVQAPLAGGPSTPALAAAVSEAGGLGSLGVAYATPDLIREEIAAVRRLTARPFAAGLLLPGSPVVDTEAVAAMWAELAPYRQELGLADDGPPTRYSESLDDQVAALVDSRVPVATFAFGIPDPDSIDTLKRQGSIVVLTVTNGAEARLAVDAGADVLSVQGIEAGGHRGTFEERSGEGQGLIALIGSVRSALDGADGRTTSPPVPVLAAGGIMDGRGIAASLALGAAGAQLGTAFLRCPEAGTSAPYRDALGAPIAPTGFIRGISGRTARGIPNRFSTEMAPRAASLPYPVLNALTRDIRRRAAELGRPEFLSLWAGQGVDEIREMPAGELVGVLAVETDRAFDEALHAR